MINDMRDLEKEYELGDIRAIATAHAVIEGHKDTIHTLVTSTVPFYIDLRILHLVVSTVAQNLRQLSF